MSFGIGSLLGPILGSLFSTTINYRLAFTLAALIVTFVALNMVYATFWWKYESTKDPDAITEIPHVMEVTGVGKPVSENDIELVIKYENVSKTEK